jgi:uncharacterized protein (TIGR03086 family)
MTEAEVYVLSERAFTRVVEQLPDDRWEETTPEWFSTNRRGPLALRELINYHAYDTAWVPDVLAGKTIEEVGVAWDGDLLGAEPKLAYRAFADAAIAAAEGLDDPERVTHLSYGEFPAREYLKHITSFRTFRAYDIAKWMGLDTTLPDDLVQGAWDEIQPEAEMWRKMGVFGPEVAVPVDAPLQDRLLGLAGRDPKG